MVLKLRLYPQTKSAAIEDFILAAECYAQLMGEELELVNNLQDADIVIVDNEGDVEHVNRPNVWVAVVDSVATKRHAPNVFFIDDFGKIKRLMRLVRLQLGKLQQV